MIPPDGRPKAIDIVIPDPTTWTNPEDGLGAYPPVDGMENGKVPLGAGNARVEPVDCSVTPSNVTAQVAPLESPVSTNVTLKRALMKVTYNVTPAPWTTTFPDALVEG